LTAIAGNAAEMAFDTTLFFADMAASAGLVRLAVIGARASAPTNILAGLLVAAVGVQIALIDDHAGNTDGTAPGPVLLEADEVVVVDFPVSPGPSEADVQAHARARRMIEYSLHQRDRAYNPSAGINAPVAKPEMPMWMGELHLWGLAQSDLLTLLALRKIYLPNNPTSMRLELQWQMNFSWRGPDAGSATGFQYTEKLDASRGAQAISLALDNLGGIDGLQNDVLTKAFSPAPVAPDFPVAGRRAPAVKVGARRAWGRRAGASVGDAVLVEWQPLVVDASNNEMMRGGNGTLVVESIKVDGVQLDPGVSVTPSGTRPFDPATPPATLPTFRIIGEDPPQVIDSLIDAVTQELYQANTATPSIAFFTLAQWQTTVRLLINHESKGHQFTMVPRHHGGSISSTFSFRGHFGEERGMPLFGPPHGYGIAQLDTPRPTVDQIFSFAENVKGACSLLMTSKASGAWASLNAHLAHDQRSRAVYQREVVRRYNGFTEFQWNGTAFVINPTLPQWEDAHDHSRGANSNLPYPNQVLGTHVVYSTGHGAATVFPWPIAFQPADFGPGM